MNRDIALVQRAMAPVTRLRNQTAFGPRDARFRPQTAFSNPNRGMGDFRIAQKALNLNAENAEVTESLLKMGEFWVHDPRLYEIADANGKRSRYDLRRTWRGRGTCCQVPGMSPKTPCPQRLHVAGTPCA